MSRNFLSVKNFKSNLYSLGVLHFVRQLTLAFASPKAFLSTNEVKKPGRVLFVWISPFPETGVPFRNFKIMICGRGLIFFRPKRYQF